MTSGSKSCFCFNNDISLARKFRSNISIRAYFGFFIERGLCSEIFVNMALALGLKVVNEPKDFLIALEYLLQECGVAEITMSQFGIKEDELHQKGNGGL